MQPNLASDHYPQQPRPFWRKLLWFAALWIAGVGTVGVIAFILRLWIA